MICYVLKRFVKINCYQFITCHFMTSQSLIVIKFVCARETRILNESDYLKSIWKCHVKSQKYLILRNPGFGNLKISKKSEFEKSQNFENLRISKVNFEIVRILRWNNDIICFGFKVSPLILSPCHCLGLGSVEVSWSHALISHSQNILIV